MYCIVRYCSFKSNKHGTSEQYIKPTVAASIHVLVLSSSSSSACVAAFYAAVALLNSLPILFTLFWNIFFSFSCAPMKQLEIVT